MCQKNFRIGKYFFENSLNFFKLISLAVHLTYLITVIFEMRNNILFSYVLIMNPIDLPKTPSFYSVQFVDD